MVPPPGFLKMLRRLCDEQGILLILDEIYTGFGRTGTWFACEQSSVRPDLICLGKALTGGFPMSACIGEATLMDAAWPESTGEAIHTSTFLGHPVGCAMALAQIAELKRLRLISRSARLGRMLLQELTRVASDFPPSRNRARPGSFQCFARGLGLMAGLELQHADGSPAGAETIEIVKRMLHRGILLLPEGEHGNVIGFTPPLILTEQQIQRTTRILKQTMVEVLGPNRTRPAGRKGRTASRRRSGRRAPAPESIPKQPQKPPALLRTRR